MKRATYIGPIDSLKGMTALIRVPEPDFECDDHSHLKHRKEATSHYLAQFDSWLAFHEGKILANGWHLFPMEDFELRQEPAEL